MLYKHFLFLRNNVFSLRKKDQPKTGPFSLSLKRKKIDEANSMHLIEYVIGFMKGNCKLDLHPSAKERSSPTECVRDFDKLGYGGLV